MGRCSATAIPKPKKPQKELGLAAFPGLGCSICSELPIAWRQVLLTRPARSARPGLVKMKSGSVLLESDAPPGDGEAGLAGQREGGQQFPIGEAPAGEIVAIEVPGRFGPSWGQTFQAELLLQPGLDVFPMPVQKERVGKVAFGLQPGGGGLVADGNDRLQALAFQVEQ